MVFLGLAHSAAARPTSSVPPKANDAVTNTEQKPLKPLRNAPGSCQYFAPIYPRVSVGTPPQSMIIPKMINPMMAMTLMRPRMNSTSPYPLTPKKLMAVTITKKMVIQTATLIEGVPVSSGSVQNAIVIPAVVNSKGRTINQLSA